MKGSAPTRVACRELSPALARLCSLALWLLRFEKTIVNRFFLLALAGPRRSSSNSVIHIKKTRQTRGLSCFLKKDYKKDTKLKADELGQKRMIFYLSGFNFNNEDEKQCKIKCTDISVYGTFCFKLIFVQIILYFYDCISSCNSSANN